MKRTPWTEREITVFLHRFLTGRTTAQIARETGRTVAAVNSMRRKMKRLSELGVRYGDEFAELLAVPEPVVHANTLRGIRAYLRRDLVSVRPFLRRNRTTGRAVLVGAHGRLRERSA